MSDADRIVKGERWCLRSIELPHGTEAQVLAWVEHDPRPNAKVVIYDAAPDSPDVLFMPWESRELLRLPRAEFLDRFQRIVWGQPTAAQVPPERPPESVDELVTQRLAGW